MRTFGNSRSWTDYRDALAETVGITFHVEPCERSEDIRGHLIRYDEWLPRSRPAGTLILVHGGGGNGRVLAPFALPALEAGWRVLAPDLPGYGLTEPSEDLEWDYAEWPAIISELASRQTGPVVLMGLSMGGMTAFAAAQQTSRVAGVIATTLFDLSDPDTFDAAARWRWLGRLSRISMKLAPWLFDRLTMPLSLAAPLDAMSSIPRMREYFRTDRLLGSSWIRARFFRTLHAFKVRSWKLDCPLLLVHPGEDDWTPTTLSLRVVEQIDADKTFIELSNGAHLPIEHPAYDELGKAMKAFLARTSVHKPVQESA